ncbi:MAG: class I SAM-dependent methyltransferase [Streptosporangiaceae bacterium]
MSHHPHHEHAAGDGHRHCGGDFDFSDMAELLDLDAEVLHEYLSDATAWVHALAADLPARRVLDLGCGTGTAALALAARFPDADVTAVDQSAQLLAHLRAKADGLGLDGRLHTVEADLDGPWPAVGPVDVAWTSMALHHLADPGRALAEIFARIRPGGLLAVAELTAPLRFLPDDVGVGRPGLEARLGALADDLRHAALPHLGADWALLMSQAGFTIVAERPFEIDLTSPLPAAAGRYIQGTLRRARGQLEETLGADDLAALDILIADDGPHSVLHRQDLSIRGSRTLWAGRRP